MVAQGSIAPERHSLTTRHGFHDDINGNNEAGLITLPFL
jgi:hypothetical protein